MAVNILFMTDLAQTLPCTHINVPVKIPGFFYYYNIFKRIFLLNVFNILTALKYWFFISFWTKMISLFHKNRYLNNVQLVFILCSVSTVSEHFTVKLILYPIYFKTYCFIICWLNSIESLLWAKLHTYIFKYSLLNRK